MIPIILFLINLIKSEDFICTNKKDPSTLSNKEYLKEFSKGKCSPFTITPGLSSTRLVVLINCPVFKKNYQDVFTLCGFTDCEKRFYEFWKTVPKSEYILWMAGVGPLDMFSIYEKTSMCLSFFLGIKVDFSKPIEKSFKKKKGVEVRVFGQSPQTEEGGKCGDGAVTNLFPFPFQIRKTKTWSKFYEKVKKMGYRRGLTYQTLPFDFRRSFTNNGMEQIFEKNVKRLNKLTNKKVVLIAHSQGVRVTYHQLTKMNQEKKNKLIKNFVGIGGNFFGSYYIDESMLIGSADYLMFQIFGIHFDATLSINSHMYSTYEARVRDPYDIYNGQEWFEAYKNRIKYENGEIGYPESGFDFLPSVEEKCSPENFDLPSDCRMGLFDSEKNFYIKINGTEYYRKDIDDMHKSWNVTDTNIESRYIDITKNTDFTKFENPGVPFLNFILRTFKTPKQMIWDEDLTEYIKKRKVYEPEKVWGYGDEVLDTTSLLISSLKWAYEFDHKKNKNAKPVKIIDVCSNYNEKYFVYDKNDSNEEFEVTKNEFFGINCDCMLDDNPTNCSHGLLVSDSYLIKTVSNIIQTNEIGYDEDFGKYIDSLNENYIKELTFNYCPQIILQY